MPINIRAHGIARQPTSYAMSTSVYDIFTNAGVRQSTPTSATVVTTPPTHAGISSAVPNGNGSFLISWPAATGPNSPIVFYVYAALGSVSAATLFQPSNLVDIGADGTTFLRIWTLGDRTTYFANGHLYTFGVKAHDGVNNVSTNMSILTATATGSGNITGVVQALEAQLNTDITTLATIDIPSIQSDLATLLSRLSATRALLLDNLDAAITSRATQTDMNTLLSRLTSGRASNLDNLDVLLSTRATQSSVNNIQNNTSFVGVVQSPLLLPPSGSKSYPVYVRLFDTDGAPADADTNTVNMTIKDSAGGVVVATAAMTRIAVGQYESAYSVSSSDQERSLFFFFDYSMTYNSGNSPVTASFNQVRSTEVQEFESKLDTLLNRLSSGRASNLDNLDAAITSRSTDTDVQTLLSRLTSTRAALLDNLDVAVSSRSTNTDMQTLLNRLTAMRAAALDLLDVAISTRASQSSLDSYTGATTPATISDAVWDELLAAHLISGSAGQYLHDSTASGIAGAVWDLARSGHQNSGTFGEIMDALLSSRATQQSVNDLQQQVSQLQSNPNQFVASVEESGEIAGTADTGI